MLHGWFYDRRTVSKEKQKKWGKRDRRVKEEK